MFLGVRLTRSELSRFYVDHNSESDYQYAFVDEFLSPRLLSLWIIAI
jgi:hypothetical protein